MAQQDRNDVRKRTVAALAEGQGSGSGLVPCRCCTGCGCGPSDSLGCGSGTRPSAEQRRSGGCFSASRLNHKKLLGGLGNCWPEGFFDKIRFLSQAMT